MQQVRTVQVSAHISPLYLSLASDFEGMPRHEYVPFSKSLMGCAVVCFECVVFV